MSTTTTLKTFGTLAFKRALQLGALSFVVACSPKRAAVSVNDNLKETTTAEKKEKSKSTTEIPMPGNKETRTASTPRSSGGTGGNAQISKQILPLSPTARGKTRRLCNGSRGLV
ncbi:MAG: hypothetical protein IOD12_13810 [Silvanigrellales bacterium]|nr:hypothetical protein [Silvanigrellales bacterium]